MTKELTKFKLFYFIRFMGDAFFYPFMTIYFVMNGTTKTELGMILAITPIITVLVNPIWTLIVKDTKTSMKIMIAMTIIEGLMIILLTLSNTFVSFALIIAVIALFCSPFIMLQDGFTATFANANRVEYSSARIWASIAYVIATTLAGYLIVSLTDVLLAYQILFIISGAFFIATALIALWIKPIEQSSTITEKPKRDFKALFKNKEFFKYIIFYTLVIGSSRIGDSFFPVYLNQGGLDELGIGLVYSAFVLFEVIVMRFLIVKGTQYSLKTQYIFAIVLFLIRNILYIFPLPLPLLIGITMLRGISWGVLIHSHVRYLIRIVKVENVTAAIMIVTLAFSIYTGIGNFLSGMLIEATSFSTMYLVHTVLIALGILVFIFFTPRYRNPEES